MVSCISAEEAARSRSLMAHLKSKGSCQHAFGKVLARSCECSYLSWAANAGIMRAMSL
jgi:hypothetical protein